MFRDTAYFNFDLSKSEIIYEPVCIFTKWPNFLKDIKNADMVLSRNQKKKEKKSSTEKVDLEVKFFKGKEKGHLDHPGETKVVG